MVSWWTITHFASPTQVDLRSLPAKSKGDAIMVERSVDAGALPIAVRVYPDLKPSQPQRKAPQIDGMLVFDCETRTDRAQALTFGSYRFLVAGRCLEEGLFYADDLTSAERTMLERYAREHAAGTDPRGIPERGIPSNPDLVLLPIADFRTLLYRVANKGRGLLCAFNFPFDASRCALGYVESRDRFLGGFTFQFFHYPRSKRPAASQSLSPRHRGQAHG
jgi:hypothetical protein